jgi:hypothetical protein
MENTEIESIMFVAKVRDNPAEFTININDAPTKLSVEDELQLYTGINLGGIDLDTLFNLSLSDADKVKLEELFLIVKYKF